MSVFSQSLELSYLMISSSNGSITFLFRAPLGIYYKRGGISYQCPFLMCVCVCVCVCAQSCLTPCDPVDVACQASLSVEFSRQEYWSGLLVSFPAGSSWPRNQACISWVSCIVRWIFHHCTTSETLYIFILSPNSCDPSLCGAWNSFFGVKALLL